MKWLVGLVLFLVIPFTAMADRGNEFIAVGDQLPEFTVISNLGKTYHSTDRGKPYAIIFFHTHCFDCRRELPVVQEMYEQFGDEVEFICISRGEGEEEVSRFWQEKGLTVPYAAQKDKSVFLLFAERVIPRIYVADERGVVQRTFTEKVSRRRLLRAFRQITGDK